MRRLRSLTRPLVRSIIRPVASSVVGDATDSGSTSGQVLQLDDDSDFTLDNDQSLELE